MAIANSLIEPSRPASRPTTPLWRALRAESADPAYHFGTRRAASPVETLRRIRPLLTRAGITRLADLTGLDWIGLPVYQAIRPNSRNLAVSGGKGLTRAQAKVSALMESLELFHAEAVAQPSVRATIGAMRPELPYDPYELCLSEPSALHDGTCLEWIAATDLWTGAPSWVPRLLCEMDWSIQERRYVPLFRPSSNGLASGNTLAEALIHGLCEVIERDCLWRHDGALFDAERTVDPETIYPRLARRILERLARAGMQTVVVDIGGPTGLPGFLAWLNHADAPIIYGGAGCHPSRLTALLRALTEAVQGRLAAIAGSRDDITRETYRRATAPTGSPLPLPFPAEARRSFRSSPSLPAIGWSAQVRDIVRRVRGVTGMAPLAVDLTRPDFGLPVTFVVAPGLRRRERI